jgi:hypothetical protein
MIYVGGYGPLCPRLRLGHLPQRSLRSLGEETYGPLCPRLRLGHLPQRSLRSLGEETYGSGGSASLQSHMPEERLVVRFPPEEVS